jgi:ribosomal protein S12 methylthiotransferase
VHFVSLGCPKNRVDSEVMLGVAEDAGYLHVDDPSQAEVIVVNTCGFIDSAKKESIDTILELGTYKQSGQCQKLVVAGCLSQKYGGELSEGLPEVDHFLGSSDMLTLEKVLAGGAQRMLVGNPADWVLKATDPRRLSTRGASAYVKIGEGFNRSCSFCIIPELRGKQRSRSVSDIESEVRALAARGVLEVNLVSQDTIAYGRDLAASTDPQDLATLAQRVANVPGIEWVRLFYLYPEKLTDAVVEVIRTHPKVVPYVDMPLQHAADSILRRMRRGHGGDRLRRVVERVRTAIPDVVFRTAFIVGHPGESDADFRELCDFVEWAEFDHVGVFHYSDEESCQSFEQDEKVPAELARQRAQELMDRQREITIRKNAGRVGRDVRVLVEGVSDESELVMVGRHAGQAPDIDGQVYLSGGPVFPGQLVTAHVVESTDYDLHAEVDESVDWEALHQERRAQTEAAHGAAIALRPSDGRRVHLRTIG